MCLSVSLRLALKKLFWALLITTLLTGCGSNLNNNPGVPIHKAFPLKKSHPSGTGFNIDNLLHIEATAFNCALYDAATPMNKSFHAKGAIVLSSDRRDYDTAEIQKMADYLFSTGDSQLPLPETLSLVPAAISAGENAQHQFDKEGGFPASGCKGTLEITNIGETAVQISGAGLQLTTAPQQNTVHYNLIDMCSFPHNSPCPGLGAGPIDYTFAFQLKMSDANAVFPGQLYSGGTKTDVGPTLDPGKTVEAILSVDSTGMQDNLIYTIVPELNLDVANEQRAVLLLPLEQTFAFAHKDQFSCYKLQGNTLVPLKPEDIQSSAWCI